MRREEVRIAQTRWPVMAATIRMVAPAALVTSADAGRLGLMLDRERTERRERLPAEEPRTRLSGSTVLRRF